MNKNLGTRELIREDEGEWFVILENGKKQRFTGRSDLLEIAFCIGRGQGLKMGVQLMEELSK